MLGATVPLGFGEGAVGIDLVEEPLLELVSRGARQLL